MKTNKIFYLLVITASLFITNCSKDDLYLELPTANKNNTAIKNHTDGIIKLGKKINDPYAIENMKEAYLSLKSSGVKLPEQEIEANKLYIRFLPKNELEWQKLKLDPELTLFDYPLHYEIKEQGTYYHDPELPVSSITWQYAVVPINYIIPDVYHELIYPVYIPKHESSGNSTNLKGTTVQDSFYAQLEQEAFRLTNNVNLYNDKTNGSLKGIFKPKRWNPAGNIHVYDNVVNRMIPLVGVEVQARWSTHIEKSITDADGNFKMGGFIYEVNYSIKWERDKYDIRDGNFGQAWYNGPKQKGDWNLNIQGGKSIMFASIHRAAWKHFYGDNLGIRRPSLTDGSKTKICYIDGKGTGVFWGDWSSTGIMPDIKIWGKYNSSGNYKPANKIFGTTAHELGHQAHSQYLGNIKFWQTDKIIYESWADVVEWALTNDEYHRLGNKYGIIAAINYFHRGNKHNSWPHVNDKAYSPIFIDLMDNVNQRNTFGVNYPNDLISGYTLAYIHNNILNNSFNIQGLQDEIKKHKITGVTDSDIDALFEMY